METAVVVLASGRGTDFQAIVDHEKMGVFKDVKITGLICNHQDAPVLKRASATGVEPYILTGVTGSKFASQAEREKARMEFDDRCVEIARKLDADLIALAGFDQILSRNFVSAFPFQIMNIHPAYDLKRFGGKNMVGRKVHELVLKSGVKYSGCAIHYVTNDVDGGPIILKKKVEISGSETPESLEEKVLLMEHLAFPEAIQLFADGRVSVDDSGRRCYIDRYSEGWDVEWEQRQKRYIDALNRTE